MNKIQAFFLAALALCLAFPLSAAEPRQQPTEREQARTVKIFHQPIVMLQATFGQTTPEERVLQIRNTLRAFTEADISQPLQVVPVTRYNLPGRLFLMNGKPIMLLSQADLDEGDDLTLDQASQRVLARMEAQRSALREQYNTPTWRWRWLKWWSGRCCWPPFITSPGAPGVGFAAIFCCRFCKSAAGSPRAGGGFSAISKPDSMPC